MGYLNRFKYITVEKIDFMSPNPRVRLPGDKDSEDSLQPNNRFPLELIVPDKPQSKLCENVVIIVNGFNEPGIKAVRMYYSSRFGISQLLRKNGIASVLLPIPFHYWRRPKKGAYRDKAYTPAHSIDKKIVRFYLGYKQLVLDIRELALHFLGKRTEFKVPRLFNKIHLMGFSLGGLGTLATFIMDQKDGENNISSSTMLFSGSSLEYVNARGIDIQQSQVDALIEYYDRKTYEKEDFADTIDWNLEEISGRMKAFRYLVLGKKEAEPEISTVLAPLMKRIPIIIGQSDNINPSGVAKKFIPPGAKHDLSHTEPGVGHFLWRDRKWIQGGAFRSIKWFVDAVSPFCK